MGQPQKADWGRPIVTDTKPMPIDAADREIHFERCKLLVNSALETSSRRHSANTYFLTVNTGLFAALGGASAAGLDLLPIGWTFFVSVCGLILCYYWHRLINSYAGLNRGKFEIIHKMEQQLPVQVFKDEWVALGEGKDKNKYRPVTELEIAIPWAFSCLYIVLFIWSLLQAFFGQ